MTHDQIYIRKLKIQTIIGIRRHERARKQTVVINLWMAKNLGKAATSEDINDTLDYGAVCRRLTDVIEPSEFLLIEALAEAITEVLQKEFRVSWFRLKLGKPEAVANAQEVGLIIERELKRSSGRDLSENS